MGKSYKNEGGGNKAARMAQKEQAALSKQRAEDDRDAREEAARWETGTKKGGKKEEQASKRAEQLRKKAEREQALEQEEADTPGRRGGPKKSNRPEKKTRGPDLSQFDKDDDDRGNGDNKKLPTLNATGIDNALDALGLDDDAPGGGGGGGSGGNKIERHPERRYPAAYARFEERRLEEMKNDGSGEGLRMNQRKAQIRKEFERHPDNPFNQVTASYNATKEEVGEIRSGTAAAIEARLAARDDGGDGDGGNQ